MKLSRLHLKICQEINDDINLEPSARPTFSTFSRLLNLGQMKRLHGLRSTCYRYDASSSFNFKVALPGFKIHPHILLFVQNTFLKRMES